MVADPEDQPLAGDSSAGQKVQVGERLRYLLQERTWAERDHSGEGDGLGKALRAATIAFRNRDASGMTSASIASQTIALVGSKTNEGSDGGWFGIGKDDSWKMYTGMRDEIADIVADYAPDLFREYSDAQGAEDTLGPPWSLRDNPADLPGGPYGMVFNRDPDVVAVGSKELGGKGASAPPAGALRRDSHGNVTGFDFGSDDYANWVQGTSGPGNPAWWGLAPGMQLPESVIDKYRSQFPNIK